MSGTVKQVIVVRTHYPDGKGGTRRIRWGKLMAQVAHASMAVFFDRITRLVGRDVAEGLESCFGPDDVTLICIPLTDPMDEWVNGTFAKVVLSVETEEELLRVFELAQEAGIPTALITDAGKTEFKAPCPTCNGKGVTRGRGESYATHGPMAGMELLCSPCEGSGKVGVPTHTAVAVGPARVGDIDKITGPEGLVTCKLA